MAVFPTCPTVCNANLAVNILASFNLTDNTVQQDTTCGGTLFLTDDPGGAFLTAGVQSGVFLSTTRRTVTVGSLTEIALHYGQNTETYKAARDFFANVGQRGVASFFLLAFWDRAGGETVTTALDAINTCNPCWTNLAMVHTSTANVALTDSTTATTVSGWAQANEKIFFALTIDILNETMGAADWPSVVAALGYADTFAVYSGIGQCAQVINTAGVPQFFAAGVAVTDVDGVAVIDPATGLQALSDGTTPRQVRYRPYTEFLTAGWISAVDLSQSGSGFDIANKPQGGVGWVGVQPTIVSNAGLTAVTGRNLDGTFNQSANGFANMYIRNENNNGMQFGMTVGGLWVDQVHLRIYLRRRIKDALTNLFVNSRRIPYDDARGMQLLASAVSNVMNQMQANGHFTGDAVRWEDFGAYVRKGVGWVIRQDSFAAQTAARKNARIAPAMSVCYIPAGATNFVPITLCTLAVPTAF